MTGYVRSNVGVEANISNGLTINATDFNAEYDAIEVAFGTSGHNHNGTAGNGPIISQVGPSSALQYEFTADAFKPITGFTSLDLGTSGLKFDNAYVNTIKAGTNSYMTITDNEIDVSSGNLTLDSAGTIVLDATSGVYIGSDTLEEYIEDITGGSLTAGTGINVTYNDAAGTGTISLSHLGLENLADPNADRILFWDDSAGTAAFLTAGSNITISGTTLSSTDTTYSDATTSVAGLMSTSDKTKLDGIEASADVTDTANVTAAGALMDSEVTNLSQVKAFDSSDYATAAQGVKADNALPKAGGIMTGNITMSGTETVDGRDLSVDGAKLDGIEASADVTDTANVTAAGALMDSELASEAAVKAINQQLTTTSSPSFTAIYTDTISEVTSANGVSIDNAKLKDGNFVPAAAKGVEYSNSYSSATGASGSSRLLNWYEEGTWTPYLRIGGTVPSDLTYYWNQAGYTRIGNIVFITGEVYVNQKGTATGLVDLMGLPYSGGSGVGSSTNLDGVALFNPTGGLSSTSASGGLVGRVAGNNITLLTKHYGSTSFSTLNAALISNSFRFDFSMFYHM